MDLKEKNSDNSIRHPWETTRLEALHRILSPCLHEGMSVLDVGCGDGYIAANLFKSLGRKQITAIDTSLTDGQIADLISRNPGTTFSRELPTQGVFDLILLLDVIEHVEDDTAFLRTLIDRHLAGNGHILITAPAFQSLFSGHDLFLGHHRRYSLKHLAQTALSGGLRIEQRGYLFSTLLLPKLLLFKLLKTADQSSGVGQWHKGPLLTGAVESVLRADNFLLLLLSRLGITVPGLTGWILGQKRGGSKR